jgi:hypothetical protein
MTKFDKFAFLRAIEDDHTIPEGQRFVLHATANRWMRHDGSDLLTVRQSHISATLGVPPRTVRRAFHSAYERGYFELATRRKSGPAPQGERTDADAIRLTVPPGANQGASFDAVELAANPTELAANPTELGAKSAELAAKSAELAAKSAELAANGNSLTSEKPSSKGVLKGEPKGEPLKNYYGASAPEPALDARNPAHTPKNQNQGEPRVCSRHPHGNQGKNFQPCPECVEVKAHNERVAGLKAWTAPIAYCAACDDNGYLMAPSKLAVFGQPKPPKTTIIAVTDVGCDPTHPVLEHLDPLNDTEGAWLVRCPHGTDRPADKREKPDSRLRQLVDEAGYETIGLDAWLANDGDREEASYAEYDAEEDFKETGEDCKKWVAAETRWKRDVEVWLDTEQRLWLEAEAEYRSAAEAWCAAADCELCDGRFVHARGEPSPLVLLPVDEDVFLTVDPTLRDQVWIGHLDWLDWLYLPTGRVLFRIICQHDDDANDDVFLAASLQADRQGTQVVKTSQTGLTAAIQRIEQQIADERRKAIDDCNLCDDCGTQLGVDDEPVMLRQLNDVDDEDWDYDPDTYEEFIGEPVPLLCHHNMAGNIAEFLDTDQRDLREFSGHVRPELDAALEKAFEDQMRAEWLAAERAYEDRQTQQRAEERAAELDMMAGIITDRISRNLPVDPW